MPKQDLYERVFQQNRRWVEEKLGEDPDYFTNLSKEQHPEFYFIGCCDSRVPANTVMGVDPGDVFVHRNIANLVVNTDSNGLSALHYAVDHLDVKHIIVCGHYGCGGIQAAMEPKDLDILNGWLREIRDVYRLHEDELNAIEDDEVRRDLLSELNVREQCVNIIKTAVFQRNYASKGYPIIHGWVYDLHTGYLKDLEVPMDDLVAKVREIYRCV